jgi:hypothetical protein
MARMSKHLPLVDVKVRESYLQHFEIALLNFDQAKREEQGKVKIGKERTKRQS